MNNNTTPNTLSAAVRAILPQSRQRMAATVEAIIVAMHGEGAHFELRNLNAEPTLVIDGGYTLLTPSRFQFESMTGQGYAYSVLKDAGFEAYKSTVTNAKGVTTERVKFSDLAGAQVGVAQRREVVAPVCTTCWLTHPAGACDR